MKSRRSWLAAVLLTLTLAAGAKTLAASKTPAEMAPADAIAFVGWSAAEDGIELVRMLDAIVRSPGLAAADDASLAEIRDGLGLLDRMFRFPGAVVFLPAEGDGAPSYAFAVEAGKNAAAFADEMVKYITSRYPDRHKSEAPLGGYAFTSVTAEGGPNGPVIGEVKGTVVVAGTRAAAERVVARLDGKTPSLAEQSRYKAGMQAIAPSDSPWTMTAYIDMLPVMKAILGASPNASEGDVPFEGLKALGLDESTCFVIHWDRVDYGDRLSLYAPINPQSELHALQLKMRPVTDADLLHIPKDAYAASVFPFNAAESWRYFIRAIEASDPQAAASISGGAAALSMTLGFSIENDLLPVLGDMWSVYDAPEHAGFLLTGFVLSMEVTDREKLDFMLERTVQAIAAMAAQGGATVAVKQGEFDGRPIKYVLAGGYPVPLAPAWGYVGDRVVIGLLPQTVASALRQADPATRTASLLDNADFKAARTMMPEKVAGVSIVDGQYAARTWYALSLLARTAAASGSAPTSQPFDLASVPVFAKSAAAAARNMVTWSSIDESANLTRMVGVSPTALMLSPAGAAGTAMGMSVLLPSLSRARELAKRTQSMSNMRQLTMGCHVYAADHGDKFPPTLDALVDADIVQREVLFSPRNPDRSAASYAYIAGQSVSLDVRNVLMYERVIDNEGAGVAFVDGRVEWMRGEELARAIRETYQRLGREAETPAEFREPPGKGS